MSLLQYVEPGGEKYLTFAKKKLAQWKAAMVRAGLRTFAKVIRVSDDSSIYIKSLQLGPGVFKDSIRITAGGFAGRFYSSIGHPDTRRFYRVRSAAPQLQAYAETTYSTDDLYYLSSLNGRSAALLRADVAPYSLVASIDELPEVVIPPETNYRQGGNSADFATGMFPSPTAAHLFPNGITGVHLSEDGTLLGTTQSSGADFPAVYRLSAGVSATEYTALSVGAPQFVTDFYAGLSVPHSLIEDPNQPAGTIGVPYASISTNLGDYFVRPSFVQQGAPIARLRYDPYTDSFWVLASMPYCSEVASSVDFVGTPTIYRDTYTFGVRFELRRFHPSDSSWSLEYVEDYPALYSAFQNGGLDQFDGEYKTQVNLTSIGAGGDADAAPRTQSSGAYAAVVEWGYGTTPTMTGVYLAAGGGYEMRRNGTPAFAAFTADVNSGGFAIGSRAPEGLVLGFTDNSVVNHTLWLGEWGAAELDLAALRHWLSPAGVQAWMFVGASPRVFVLTVAGTEAKVLDNATGLDPADADHYEANKEPGVYAVVDTGNGEAFSGWRHDLRTRAKMNIYYRMVREAVTSGGSQEVSGGTLDIPGVGTLVFDAASTPTSGLAADGSGLYTFDGEAVTFLSEAVLEAVFGVDVTISPNGVLYTIGSGGSGETTYTYSWQTKWVDLEWDTAAEELKIRKVYSDALIAVASRGDLEETISGVTSESTSEAGLAQDYLVMRPPARAIP